MTERFKIGLDLITIEDTSKEYGALNQDEVVDLLNELYMKNQDNEAMIEFLSTENTQMRNELKTRTQIQHQLEEENKELKTTIQQLRTDNTKQKKKLNTTMKENEHIKQTIKDMIESERTEIGKMTLRHLWRQIQ